MSKKYSNTTADYLTWDQNLNLIRKLFDDREYKISLLIAVGSFWGLRDKYHNIVYIKISAHRLHLSKTKIS